MSVYKDSKENIFQKKDKDNDWFFKERTQAQGRDQSTDNRIHTFLQKFPIFHDGLKKLVSSVEDINKRQSFGKQTKAPEMKLSVVLLMGNATRYNDTAFSRLFPLLKKNYTVFICDDSSIDNSLDTIKIPGYLDPSLVFCRICAT